MGDGTNRRSWCLHLHLPLLMHPAQHGSHGPAALLLLLRQRRQLKPQQTLMMPEMTRLSMTLTQTAARPTTPLVLSSVAHCQQLQNAVQLQRWRRLVRVVVVEAA